MGFKNREVEAKLLVEGDLSLASVVKQVEDYLNKAYPQYDEITGNSFDLYWNAPKDGLADFVRLRRTPEGAQITLKATDKGDNIDRVEIDLEVDDYAQAKALMCVLHGEPAAKVQKKYLVYFLENSDTTISVYQVKDDDRVFVEIEARTKKRMQALVKGYLSSSEQKCSWIRSSLYQIFVQKKQMVKKDTSTLFET